MSVDFKPATFKKTTKYLLTKKEKEFIALLEHIGLAGVEHLKENTPKDTGKTADSWSFSITYSDGRYRLAWSNSVMAGETPLVVLIQYGHGTKHGGYVSPVDFMNPALKSVFKQFNQQIIVEVQS